ncbi:MAG: iron-containing alcohol dehydrogenase [Parvibaculaceae bacterium]
MTIITYLTTIRFDFGALQGIAGDVAQLKIERPLIVTDAGLKAAGFVDRLCALLPNPAMPVFDGTPTNPTETAVKAALALYRSSNCDGVIAIGGGSPIDLAKAVALLATHPEPLAQYAVIDGGLARITPAVAPLIAIPTTAGTGSEVGRAALVTLEDGRKVGIISSYLIPKLAICDPELTLGLPARLTAATGMDAIAHCIETYLSPRINPPAEAIALDGLSRAMANIKTATSKGDDRTARSEMMMAALEGGLTFQKGLGAVHGLSHALGSLSAPAMHHGMLNAILLPDVLKFNEPSVDKTKWQALCRAADCPAGQPLHQHIVELTKSLGLPLRLSDLGYDRRDADDIVTKALKDHSTPTNPRKVERDDYMAILKAAL